MTEISQATDVPPGTVYVGWGHASVTHLSEKESMLLVRIN